MGAYSVYILYALIFITVLLVVEGIYLMISSQVGGEQIANKRIKLIKKSGNENAGIEFLRKKTGGSFNQKIGSVIPAIQRMLWSANSAFTAAGFVMLCGILFFVTIVIATSVFSTGLFLGLILAIKFGIVWPYIYFRRKAAKRQKLFSEQLCPAIDLVARGLQAGHPAAVALEMVSKEMPDPIGTEFGLAMDEINYGLDRNVALTNITERFPNADMRFFVSALEIQKETGGNLVHVLNNLSNIIRTRRAMRKKIVALSAEGRVTMYIVGGLPFVIIAIITVMNPLFYTEYADDPIFKIGMAIPAVFYFLGMYWIRRMIQIKI